MERLSKLRGCLIYLLITNIACCQSKNINDNQVVMNPKSKSGLLVCKLSGPELQKRKAALQQEIFSQVKGLKEVENGYIFHFMDEGDFIEKFGGLYACRKKMLPIFSI